MRSFPVSLGLGCVFLCSSALSACDTSSLPDGALGFVTAAGDDPWSGPPAVDHVQVELVQASGRSTLADVKAPPDTLSLGNEGPSDVIATFEATGFTSDGDAVVFGSSVPGYVYGFAGAYVPMFVARKGGFATAPSALLFPHTRPLTVIGPKAYVLIAGGADAAFDVYSSATWVVVKVGPPLPQTVKTIAVSGTTMLMINDDAATWLDLGTFGTAAAPEPTSITWANIVGGGTLVASDGTIYIVGATRTEGEPTNQVLQIDTAGKLHAFLLNTPRLGAAAALVKDALLVAGGSADGAGAELLAVGATRFTELALPADETIGAGLVELTSASALLAGGHDANGSAMPTRTIDLGCTKKCSATEVPEAGLSIARTSAFKLADNVALVVGETDDEQTHAYLFDGSGDDAVLTEKALRTPRSQASAVQLPNGQVAILGGTDLATGSAALTLDVFFP